MDIMDEARILSLDHLEMDGVDVPVTEIMADDNLRAKAIKILDAKLKPYFGKDFPYAIAEAWITKLYLGVKDDPINRCVLELVLHWDRIRNVYPECHPENLTGPIDNNGAQQSKLRKFAETTANRRINNKRRVK